MFSRASKEHQSPFMATQNYSSMPRRNYPSVFEHIQPVEPIEKGFEIDVKGEAEILLPPERAVLNIKLNDRGTVKSEVTASIIHSARNVQTLLRNNYIRKEE